MAEKYRRVTTFMRDLAVFFLVKVENPRGGDGGDFFCYKEQTRERKNTTDYLDNAHKIILFRRLRLTVVSLNQPLLLNFDVFWYLLVLPTFA